MDKVEEMKAWLTEAALNAGVKIEKMERVKQDQPFPNDDIFMARVVVTFKNGKGSGSVWMHGEEIDTGRDWNFRDLDAMGCIKSRWRAMMREVWRSVEGPADSNGGGQR